MGYLELQHLAWVSPFAYLKSRSSRLSLLKNTAVVVIRVAAKCRLVDEPVLKPSRVGEMPFSKRQHLLQSLRLKEDESIGMRRKKMGK